jgi:hypothetical protein
VVTSGSECHVTLNPPFTISDRRSSAMACTTGGPMHRIDAIDRRRGHRSRTAKCTRLIGLQERETVHKLTDCCRVRRRVRQKGSSNLRSFCCGLMVGLNKTGCRPHPERILQTIFALRGIIENRRSTKSLNPHPTRRRLDNRIARTFGALPFDHVNESFFINGGGSCRNVESHG